MIYHLHSPPLHLAHLVKSMWMVEGQGVWSSDTYRLMADSCPELLFQYRGQFWEEGPKGEQIKHPSAMITGPTRHHQSMKISGAFGLIGVCLFPHAIECLFGLPGKEISNQRIEAKELMGASGRMLEEKLLAARNHLHRIELLTDYLTQCLQQRQSQDTRIQSGIFSIFQHRGNMDIAKLADHLCLSTRQLERSFKSTVGISPKLFSRIVRFQSSFQHSAANPQLSLTGLAHHCGYADQAHFTREFKEFAGISPKQYFRLTEEVADSFMRM